MAILPIESAAGIVAYLLDGTTACNQAGHCRAWSGDEFICISAIDQENNLLVSGTQRYKSYCFKANQIAHIIATDTPQNRALLRNFQPGIVEWMVRADVIVRADVKALPRKAPKKSCRKNSLQPVSHVDARGWALNPNTGLRQPVAS